MNGPRSGTANGTIATAACYKCGVFYANDDKEEVRDFLDDLREEDPEDHEHDGLGVVIVDREKVFA